MSSADNLCKQFGPRSGSTKRQAWSESKLLDTLPIFTKEFFRKTTTNWFCKKNISRRQNQDKLPLWQRVNELKWKVYLHVSSLSLIFTCYNTAQSRTHIDFTIECACVCVEMMTSEVCGIDFSWLSLYRYSCRLVYISKAMPIYVYLLIGVHMGIFTGKNN